MGQLIFGAVLGIVVIVALIVWLKMNAFLALMIGSGVMAVCAGVGFNDMFKSFTTGFGSTMAGVGLLIVFGAITGRFLVSSGGAEAIVDSMLARTSASTLPWAMAAAAFLVGIPLFFEVGVVILIPIVLYAAKRANKPVILLGVPALAGLSTLHAFVPPHPGPLVAIDSLGASLGVTLGLGLLIAIPTVIVAGPLFSKLAANWVPIEADTKVLGDAESVPAEKRPSVATSVAVVLLPVILMLAATVFELTGHAETGAGKFFAWLGSPLVALFITALVAMGVFGLRGGLGLQGVSNQVSKAVTSVAGILLIVAAGGGFKQTLVDSGIADLVAKGILGTGMSIFLAGWLVSALVRVATGSATVATITAAGIMAPVATGLSPAQTALLVLAVGAGSVFLSHVNDAGFWLVKEYFGMSVGQTFKTWTVLECLISLVGLASVLLVSLVV